LDIQALSEITKGLRRNAQRDILFTKARKLPAAVIRTVAVHNRFS
jgi:hypothetical protein